MSNSRQLATVVASNDPNLEVLRAGWFGALPDALQARIAGRSRPVRFARGEYLIRQGDAAVGLFGLLTGRTHHLRQVGESDEVLLHVGAPGLWVGEYPLLSGEGAVGSVVAATPCLTLFLPAREFETIVDEDPRLLRHLARLLTDRYALAYRFLAEARGLAPEDWLLSRLRGILEVQRACAGPGVASDTITITRAQLANLVGLSRQTSSVLLARLVERGSIELGFKSVTVRAGPPDQAPGSLEGRLASR